MNPLFTMKRWQSLLAFVLLAILWATPARAGEWVLDGYFWSGTSESARLFWVNRDRNGGEDYVSRKQTQKRIARNQNAQSLYQGTPSHATVIASGLRFGGDSVEEDGIANGKGKVASSVYARFSWRRNIMSHYDEATGDSFYYYDPNDNPPKYVYARETASVSASTRIYQADGNPTGYTPFKRWQGDYFEIIGNTMGLELGDAHRPDWDGVNAWAYGPNSKVEVRRIATSGDQVTVPSRTFAGTIELSPGYEKEIYDQYVTGSLNFGYDAELLNFTLHASAPAVANREEKKENTEEIDALVQLRWLHPENIGTGEDEDPIKPSRSAAKRYWDGFLLGDGQMDDNAPIPYFAGQATFTASATRSDGYSPVFNGQIYNWTPEDNTDPFDPDGNGTPGFVESSPSQRVYVWNFGSARGGEGSFPKTSSVSVEVKPSDPDDTSEPLKATKTISWYTVWNPTDTGFQKNEAIEESDQLTLPDGSPIPIWQVEEGTTILCFVSGSPGASTDSGRIEKVRPVPFGQQNSPRPGERVEPRTVTRITPTGDGSKILNFESTPTVHPDDDPNAPGFDEFQQAKKIQETAKETKETGAFLVGTALEGYVELAKLVSTERIGGWAFEGAIKGVVAAGKLAQVAKGARAVAANATKDAAELRAAANALKAARSRMSASQAAKADDEIRLLNKAAREQDELARQGTSMANRADDYARKAANEAREAGCFVAGTPVWMSDGTTKPIEQVKVGDLVLSKNEKTGEVAAKKVTNVSVRADIWTRKLSFDNGAVLETTDEHPLYVEGSGFAKAKEVGIGSSIVTRAGPSAKVVGVQADVRQATVYNFTVADFHTYFVGENALWVHNNPPCNLGEYRGRATKVEGDASTIRSLTRENESIEPLIGNGYGVHQNPPTTPNGKNPDYFLKGPSGSGVPQQGAYFDCYAPAPSTQTGNIVDTMAGKVNRGQADRIVLNMKDSNLTLSQVEDAIRLDLSTPDGGAQLSGLQQILVIDKSGNLIPFFPFS